MIRVVIADDQDLVRTGLRSLLTGEGDIEVAAEARTGQEAIDAVRSRAPDVVLMDIRMPVLDGLEATRQLRADPAVEARILILTTFDDEDDILEAVRLGAAGYLLKDTPADELRRAVRTAAEGGNMLSPAIARRVMEHMARTTPQAPAVNLSTLTDRERDVLARIARGESNAEIGAALYLSPATARTYVSRILTKLGARDRTELAILAHRAGLGG